MGTKQTNSSGFGKPAIFVFVAILLVATTGIVRAMLIDDPDVIEPPVVIANDATATTNDKQQAFNERQGVEISSRVRCTGQGDVPLGEVVDSHVIFYNSGLQSPESDVDRIWTFAGEIVCVMAETSGLYQGTTDGIFGVPGVAYGSFSGRGLERDGTDAFSVEGNQLTLTMTSEPTGDWIRVLTRSVTPPNNNEPVVFCEPRSNPADKEDNKGQGTPGGPFVSLIGADFEDGPVDIYVIDDTSGVEFGPFEGGDVVQISTAKSAPRQLEGNGSADYRLRVQGPTTISAEDQAGNTGESVCTQ